MDEKNHNWMVCVRCYTYNHESYITDAMNGFVMQQTAFPFVCCIVDDASKDNEQDVILQYVESNFEYDEEGLFKKDEEYGTVIYARHKTNRNCYFAVVLLKENHNGSPERKTLKRSYIAQWETVCKYEALCEGDDYWTDPLKLQKQVDFLESHPDYSMVCTKCDKYIQNSNQILSGANWGHSGEISFFDLIQCCQIATLTVVIRRNILFTYREFIKGAPVWSFGDYPIWLYASTIGRIMKLNDFTAVYRVLENSASHFKDVDSRLKWVHSEFSLFDYFENRYKLPRSVKRKSLFNRCHKYGKLAISANDMALKTRIKTFYKNNHFFIAWISFMIMEKYPKLSSISNFIESHLSIKSPAEGMRNIVSRYKHRNDMSQTKL